MSDHELNSSEKDVSKSMGLEEIHEKNNTVDINELLNENNVSMSLFRNKGGCMWTSSYEANAPSEDRHASLINMILEGKEEDQIIRMSMWAVLDGHGGGAVSTYASQALLPHIAVNVSRALQTRIMSKGEFTVDGEVQNVEVLDFEDILRGRHEKTSMEKYLNKRQRRDDDDDDGDDDCPSDRSKEDVANLVRSLSSDGKYQSPELLFKMKNFENQDLHRVSDDDSETDNDHKLHKKGTSNMGKGTHSKKEVAAVRQAIHESFLQLDDSWMNSINPEKRQRCCMPGGQWNVGSCALITCIIQRVDLLDSNTVSRKRKMSSLVESVENIDSINDYHAHDAMLYTAHLGDCRAVLGRLSSGEQSYYDSAISDSETDDSDCSFDEDYCNDFPSKLRSIDLTTDHNPYNINEVDLVLSRTHDPLAISCASNGGIKRVAGTLAITRALGDAYLKTPMFSFPPYKRHAPYITAMPEISNRILRRNEHGKLCDPLLILATDGLWEQASGRDIINWLQTYFTNQQYHQHTPSETSSDYIIKCVLHKIMRTRGITSLRSLMALKKGRARRSKHDDITATVVDLSGFVL